MKVLIIEDETTAAQNLQRLIRSYPLDIEVLGVIKSIKKSIEWLLERESEVDLIFMDIKLSMAWGLKILNSIWLGSRKFFTLPLVKLHSKPLE